MTERGRHARTSGIDEDSTAPQSEAEILSREPGSSWPFDPELVRLVQFINTVDSAGIGLTLHVKGCMVSGMLISAAQYYRMIVEEFTDLSSLSDQSNRELALSFAEFYRPAREKVEKGIEECRAGKKPPELPRHIHFRHAQTITNGQGPFTQSLWRGRLAEVDGWSFGTFGPITPLDHKVSL